MSDELYHWGIRGMRWGRRNGPPYPLSESKHNAVVRTKSVKRYKRTDEMDDETLKKATARIKAENEYITLVNDRRSTEISRGKRFVNKFKDHFVDDMSATASKALTDFMDKKLREQLGLTKKS